MSDKMKMSISSMIFRMLLVMLGLIVLSSNIMGYADRSAKYSGEEKKMSAKKIEDVLREHTNDLMSIPGAVGTGQGVYDNQTCITVFVVKKTSELEEKIPEKLGGHPVKIEETGAFRALPRNER